jgi:hypothetical protein
VDSAPRQVETEEKLGVAPSQVLKVGRELADEKQIATRTVTNNNDESVIEQSKYMRALLAKCSSKHVLL